MTTHKSVPADWEWRTDDEVVIHATVRCDGTDDEGDLFIRSRVRSGGPQ